MSRIRAGRESTGGSGLGRLGWEPGSGLQVLEVLESGQARTGCSISGNYYWTRVELDWWSVGHRRGSLMLCGCSASPVKGVLERTVIFNVNTHSGRIRIVGLLLIGVLTSKIILCSPKQNVEPNGLVLLADEDL